MANAYTNHRNEDTANNCPICKRIMGLLQKDEIIRTDDTGALDVDEIKNYTFDAWGRGTVESKHYEINVWKIVNAYLKNCGYGLVQTYRENPYREGWTDTVLIPYTLEEIAEMLASGNAKRDVLEVNLR